jgi:L-seryl-tRNA(Ser) seleniumtransferase/D-glucosaminate-6-phosphate ammonia-lyase
MSGSPYVRLGLKRVINAAGKMTALGGTAQGPEVALAMADAAQHHVEMGALRQLAARRIAEQTGAEDASITSGAAAGIAIGVAAMITGTDAAKAARLPDSNGLANEIILQAGHDVHFGARVSQMVSLGGGRPVLAGSAGSVTTRSVEDLVGPRTAGLLFVRSHHNRQSRGLELPTFVAIARAHALPVLVDAAAEEDLRAYVAAGADLVTYSGGKAIGGPTVGFIAGRRELVAACELQNSGIARAMKVGKEQIVGLLAALEGYPRPSGWTERLDALREALAGLPGVRISIEADLAGRDIRRVGLAMEPPGALKRLVASLQAGDPAIHTRNHQIDQGLVLFDVREVRDTDIAVIAERVAAIIANMRGRTEDPGTNGEDI